MSKPSAALYALKAVVESYPHIAGEPVTWGRLSEMIGRAADEQADTEWQDYMGDDL